MKKLYLFISGLFAVLLCCLFLNVKASGISDKSRNLMDVTSYSLDPQNVSPTLKYDFNNSIGCAQNKDNMGVNGIVTGYYNLKFYFTDNFDFTSGYLNFGLNWAWLSSSCNIINIYYTSDSGTTWTAFKSFTRSYTLISSSAFINMYSTDLYDNYFNSDWLSGSVYVNSYVIDCAEIIRRMKENGSSKVRSKK